MPETRAAIAVHVDARMRATSDAPHERGGSGTVETVEEEEATGFVLQGVMVGGALRAVGQDPKRVISRSSAS